MAEITVENNLFRISVDSRYTNYGLMRVFESQNYRLEGLLNDLARCLSGNINAIVESIRLDFKDDIKSGNFGSIASTISNSVNGCKFLHIGYIDTDEKDCYHNYFQRFNNPDDESVPNPCILYVNGDNKIIFPGYREVEQDIYSKIEYFKPSLHIDKHKQMFNTLLDAVQIYENTNIENKNTIEFRKIVNDIIYLRHFELKNKVNILYDFDKDTLVVSNNKVSYTLNKIGVKHKIDMLKQNFDTDRILDFMNEKLEFVTKCIHDFEHNHGDIKILSNKISQDFQSYELVVEYSDEIFRQYNLDELLYNIPSNMINSATKLEVMSSCEENYNMIYYLKDVFLGYKNEVNFYNYDIQERNIDDMYLKDDKEIEIVGRIVDKLNIFEVESKEWCL